MVEFLSTQLASHEFENLIKNAKEHLYIICPHIETSESLIEFLKSKLDQKVKVILIHRTGNISQSERQRWLDLKNVSLRHLPNLNAKCVFNEESMIIGSLNILDKFAQHSRDTGSFN